MEKLEVDLADRSYPIYIGQDLLASADNLLPKLKGRQVLVVTNETVAPLYLDTLLETLKGYDVDSIILPDGEVYKTLDTLNLIYTHLLEKTHSRTTTLIALGGGVIGDITGYAAASYQRGVDFIQIPTTLLAQVDSSVGGKTGVNHPLGKNMIGAFHQPRCVIADASTLNTLPERELSAGIAEVIKYGLIRDAEFFNWLELNIDKLLARDAEALAYAIKRSCELKAEVVAADEKEGGLRAILNLGHTFGHAIEASMGYGVWLHGEAVAAGMVMAVDMSVRMGMLGEEVLVRTKALLKKSKLPLFAPETMTLQQFLSVMAVDKKNIDKQIRLVLLQGLGDALITSNFTDEQLTRTIESSIALGC